MPLVRFLVPVSVLCILVIGATSGQEAQHQRLDDSSFVIISAIKSVAGERPANEFFDINLKFLGVKPQMTLASFDVALTEVSTDSVMGTQKKLTEAGVVEDILTNWNADRSFMAGGVFKVFNEVAYAGVNFGGIELRNSKMMSSYLYVGFLWRLQAINDDNRVIEGITQSYQNLYAEFALHSEEEKIGLLKSLRIKGGILMPLVQSQVSGILSRIVIEVPIGGIFSF